MWYDEILLLLFSHPGVSESLQPHGLQHARPPCPSLSPKVCPSSRPLSLWCHPAISSSDTLFYCPQSFPDQGLFQWVGCSRYVTKILELQLNTPVSIQGWFPLRLTGLISLLQGTFRNLLQYHNLKASVLWRSVFFTVQLSQLYTPTGKTIALTIRITVSRVTSLLFNTVLVCHSFPAKKQSSTDFMAAVTICSDFRAQEEEISLVPPFPLLYAMK